LDVSIDEVEAIWFNAEDETLPMRVQCESPDWERAYVGEAVHTPAQ
jgi:hypothetical protein